MSKEKEKVIQLFGIYRKSEGWIAVRASFNIETKKIVKIEDTVEETRSVTEESFKRLVAKHWMELDNA